MMDLARVSKAKCSNMNLSLAKDQILTVYFADLQSWKKCVGTLGDIIPYYYLQ